MQASEFGETFVSIVLCSVLHSRRALLFLKALEQRFLKSIGFAMFRITDVSLFPNYRCENLESLEFRVANVRLPSSALLL